MGGTCSTHRRANECTQNVDRKTNGRDHLAHEGVSLAGKIILKWILDRV
jgi:hypothetical protein